jgi:hypothetical protein
MDARRRLDLEAPVRLHVQHLFQAPASLRRECACTAERLPSVL